VSEGLVRLIFTYTGLSIKTLPYLECIHGNLDFWPRRTPTDIASPVAVEVLSRIVQKHIFLNAREHGLTFKY
jgi:hypothetical protein